MKAGKETGTKPSTVHAQDPEVKGRATRRRHTVAYKLQVLETIVALRSKGNGAVGSYLRKEGLYYSSVHRWEQMHSRGELTARRRGVKQQNREDLLAENKQLRRKNEQLEKRLAKTELIVELQKKLSSIIQISTEEESEKRDEP